MPQDNLPWIFVIGDSISIQYGPYLERALQGTFRYSRKSGEAEALANLDASQGANGGDSSRVFAYLEEQVRKPDFRPDLLLVNCGLHDIKTPVGTHEIQVPLADYRSNLQKIVSLLKQAGIPMAWICTTHLVESIHNDRPGMSFHRFPADNADYNQAAEEVMSGAGVPMIDLHRFTRNLGEDAALFCDHVHFAEPIREKQAAFIAGWLDSWKGARGKSG